MLISLEGRVANTNLPLGQPLLPLFEAIVNSIHAIEDAKTKRGKIKISVKRSSEYQPELPGQRKTYRPIIGFTIEDNGVGFNKSQYTSFETSDTTLKRNRGAKGIGRFLWLKAFTDVSISSTFKDEDGGWLKREFKFKLPEGIAEHNTSKATDGPITVISLGGFATKYEENCPRKPQTIAEKIIEHCLVYFLSSHCPVILLADDESDIDLDLNQLFESYKKEISKESLKLKGNLFEIEHVKIYAGESVEHSIHLCGNERNVKNIKLENKIPFLQPRLKDDKGEQFTYFAYVNSPYLDTHVNAERTDFNLPKQGELCGPSDLTEEEISKLSLAAVQRHLEKYLTSFKNEMRAKVEKLVREQMPELRPLLTSIEEFIEELPPSADDTALMAKLNEIQFKMEQDSKQKGLELAKKQITDYRDLDEYKREKMKYAARLSSQTTARLAQYVLQRKAYLSLFEQKLGLKDGEYSLEEAIHNLIFPMRQTSDSVEYESHNLWVIDERLAYHHYLASDLPLKKVTDSKSTDRPDIVVFKNALAFSETAESTDPINSVVIIEFKRPERKGYDKSPIEQVYRYIDSLREKKVKADNGRTVPIQDTTHFYCYIICDISDEIQRYASDAGFTRTPDGRGYFGLNRNYSAYVEIISFDKMLSDAQKRNRIFFDKLGLL